MYRLVRNVFKGNTQFIFLFYHQKSGASQVRITFLQLTQKNTDWKHISLTGTNHWNSKLSTNIQCKKNHHSAFLIFQKLCQNINKKTISLAYFGPLEANYIQFIRLLTLHCFSLTLITGFSYVQCHIFPSLSTIFSFCVSIFTFLVILFSPQDTFYKLQCLIRLYHNLPIILRR